MKRFILLFALITISIVASAQIRLGARAGLTFNNLLYTQTQDPDLKNSQSDFIQFNAAAVANYKITKIFSLQTEFIYNTLGKNYTKHTYYTNTFGDVYTNYDNVKIRLMYFEVPLLAKFTLFGNQKVNLYMLAGAFAGYNLSAKQKTGDASFQNSNDYTSWNAGVTWGLGFSIMQQRMFFEMRANRGLVDINRTNEKVHTAQAMYTMGYYIFRSQK